MGTWISTCCDCDCFGREGKRVTARDIIVDMKHFTEDELEVMREYMIKHDPFLFQGQGCLGGCC